MREIMSSKFTYLLAFLYKVDYELLQHNSYVYNRE